MRLNRFGFVFALAMVAGCSGEPASTSGFELSIAHINDTHSVFDPLTGSFQAQLDEHPHSVYTEFGGHPRLLTKIEQHRSWALSHDRPLLFLHGGDAWQGTAYFQLNEGMMNADILSQLGLDAMALGNHEFDLTNAHLNAFLDAVNFPMVAANINTDQDPDLKNQTNLLPYVIYAFSDTDKQRIHDLSVLPEMTQASQLVAIFGLALDDMPTISPNTGEVQFFDMVESAQQTVDELKALGIPHIIAVTHIGHSEDMRVARSVNGIDAIVGGHSHTLLGDFSNIGWDHPADYAQKVLNPNGRTRTCVVQAGQYAQAMGLVHLRFNAQGELEACEGGNTLLSHDEFFWHGSRTDDVRVTAEGQTQILDFIAAQDNIAVVPEAISMREHIDTYYKPALMAAYGDVIGFVPETIPHVRLPADGHGSALAPLVAESQFQWFAREDIIAVTGLKPDFALVGAGGIRQALEQGELREGNIRLEMLPFGSHLSLVPLTGQQVQDLLHDIIVQVLPEGAHAGKFPYGGRLRYHFRETKQGEDGVLVTIEVNRGSLASPDWQPLSMESRYNVVMSSYLAAGNDGWLEVYRAQRDTSERIDLALVNGTPQVFAVRQVEQLDGQRLQTHYEAEQPNCRADKVECALDALSFITFLRDQWHSLAPLPYPVVTLERVQ